MKIKYYSFILLIMFIARGISYPADITNQGYLNVNSDPTRLKVYLDGDSIGFTPILAYPLKPGEYSISLFSSDSIEQKYWKLSEGGICSRFSSLMDLTKVGAATQRVEIKPNKVSEVFFSLRKINRAPTKAKIASTCCITTGFAVSVLLGVLIGRSAK